MTESANDAGTSYRPTSGRERRPYVWGSEIPFQNPHFTGRETEIQLLREQLGAGGTAVLRHPPSALFGLGGVGKTQIATEYAHRYAEEYDVVWWVRSDQEDLIKASLVGLGTRLRLSGVSPGDRDRSLRLVLEALEAGDPYPQWLLIFDDVAQPQVLRRYVPQGGHVIVTSRFTEWHQVLSTDGIEVREFARDDTIRFFRDRVPQLAPAEDPAVDAAHAADANGLAALLGDLPLAAEHAAAYLSQAGGTVADYMAAFDRDAHALLAQDADMFASNLAVATTWSVTRHTLSPEARELFQLLTFFAAEPISEEVLIQAGRLVLDPALPAPLQKVLSSRTELKRAQRELNRFSLASVYGQRNVVQLHRVVQAVTKARIGKESPDLAQALRRNVFALLAATDPDSPEREQNDPIYERTIQHLTTTGALESDNRQVRNLIINQVRRLRYRGGDEQSLSLGEAALNIWKTQPDDIQTLALATEVGWGLRNLRRVEEAFALNDDTLRRLHEHYGEDDDTYLICANSYSADLCALGRYDEALAQEQALLPVYDRVFGPTAFRPLSLRNNIAIALRCVGRYTEAQEYDTQVAEERLRQFGANSLQVADSKFGMGRNLRQLGRYEEALKVCREIADIMEARNEPWNFGRLLMYNSLSVALRRAGYHEEARDLAEDVYRRYLNFAGEEHRYTLSMATNLMCDRRVTDDLVRANSLGEATVTNLEKACGDGHPSTLTAKANLAVIQRMRGYPAVALEINKVTLDGFRQLYAYDHPSILIVMTNLASDLAAVGEAQQARELGEELLAKSQDVRGTNHPATLAAAANLALDLRATGDRDAAQDLKQRTLAAYDEQLSPEHPQTLRAKQQGRINVDIEPMYY